jgi:hypothetical protein
VACLSSDIPSDGFVGHAADFHAGLNLCRVCCRRWLHLDKYSHNVGFLQLPLSSCLTVENVSDRHTLKKLSLEGM